MLEMLHHGFLIDKGADNHQKHKQEGQGYTTPTRSSDHIRNSVHRRGALMTLTTSTEIILNEKVHKTLFLCKVRKQAQLNDVV